ncbi:hypothetical protein DPMN_002815 [Dreissena polymorpha]|uniref:Uncharacterized protein n=1 Tax=Dreissena polymorpha TaxID=45954 RepID=A0A9D4MN16_DREPO|nr:hypothetical protein DPMN_002815 [Dreissena polymorpha]
MIKNIRAHIQRLGTSMELRAQPDVLQRFLGEWDVQGRSIPNSLRHQGDHVVREVLAESSAHHDTPQ